MGKVYLEAFNGRLTSKPMDWPDDKIGQDIYLVMDMERPSVATDDMGKGIYESTTKKCRFEYSKSHYWPSAKEAGAIYKLVEVQS